MTIYATPFDPSTGQCTGPSVATPFETLDAAELAFGPPKSRGARFRIYDNLFVSDYVMRTEK